MKRINFIAIGIGFLTVIASSFILSLVFVAVAPQSFNAVISLDLILVLISAYLGAYVSAKITTEYKVKIALLVGLLYSIFTLISYDIHIVWLIAVKIVLIMSVSYLGALTESKVNLS